MADNQQSLSRDAYSRNLGWFRRLGDAPANAIDLPGAICALARACAELFGSENLLGRGVTKQLGSPVDRFATEIAAAGASLTITIEIQVKNLPLD
jgi:hypothetical protein